MNGPAGLFPIKRREEIASFCKMMGIRPTALFEWNDPNEWMARIKFDFEIMSYLPGGGNSGNGR